MIMISLSTAEAVLRLKNQIKMENFIMDFLVYCGSSTETVNLFFKN